MIDSDGGRPNTLQVALVHDYLNQRGGAERVVLEMSEMWPSAPIYTSLYRAASTFPAFRQREIRTSFLDRFPVDTGFRNLFPLYPAAFRSLGEVDGDVVVASTSGWAHMARASPRALHVVYCHTPARWLYGGEYLSGVGGESVRERAIAPIRSVLRRADGAAAHRADLYIANSENVKRKIRDCYGIDAQVIHPPVAVERFTPQPRGERFLAISRLLPYKGIDLLVAAANRAGVGLDVVGDGPLMGALREAAGPAVTLHGAVDDEMLLTLTQQARGVCVCAAEDFGIVPVEAQAAGKPVVAYGGGGALETVVSGKTGVFFTERTVEAIVEALRQCDELDTAPQEIADNASRFSRSAFREHLTSAIRVGLEHMGRSPAVLDVRPPSFAT